MATIFARITFFVAVLFPTTKAFAINGLPAVVTEGQVNILTWSRELNDPTNFQLAKSSAGKVPLGVIGSPVTANQQEDFQGTLPVTYNDPSQVTIVAYDLKHVQLDVLVDPFETKPPPFFATARAINVQPPPQMPSTQVPSQPITTPAGTHAPTITGTASSTQNRNGTPVTILNSTQALSTVSPSVSVNSSSTATSGTVTTNEPVGVGASGTLTIDSLASSTPSPTLGTSRKSNAGVIAGGVTGGVLSLVGLSITVFLLRRRAKRHTNKLEPIPFSGTMLVTPPPDSNISQMRREKEQIQLQLEAYSEQATQSSSSGSAALDDTNGENPDDDAVQALRHQVEVLKRRMGILEEGMAPPDYRSGTA